jgi:hypothetical protein
MKSRQPKSLSISSILDIDPQPREVLPPDAFRDPYFWVSQFKRLTTLANRRMWRRRWAGTEDGRPPADIEAQDYVLEACELLIQGRRKCPAAVPRDVCVARIVESLISHDASALETRLQYERLQAPLIHEFGFDEALDIRNALDSYKTNFSPGPIHRYLDLLALNPDISAQDAADELGISLGDILSMRKVFKRKRSRWRQT